MTHPLRLIVAFVLGMAALSAFLGAAARAEPALRPEITVHSDIVVLGDLVSDAGALASHPVFRAPAPGLTGQVEAQMILDAAASAGLANVSTGGLDKVTVTRPGRAAGKAEIEGALRLALADHVRSPAPENINISFDNEPLITAKAPADARLLIASVSWAPKTGHFEAEVVLGDAGRPFARETISGNAVDSVEVVVPIHNITRSRTLGPNDLTVIRMPRSAIPADAVTELEQAMGMAASRTLRADEPLRVIDLAKPVLVERGATVTLIHAVPGMTLTVRGQALAAGIEGAGIAVLNIQSKRTVQGTVTGPNQVTVTAGPAVMLSSR